MRVFLLGLSPWHTNLKNLHLSLCNWFYAHFLYLIDSLHAYVRLYSRHSFLYMFFWFEFIDTRVIACAHHLVSFYVLVGLLSDNSWTCMSRSRSLKLCDLSRRWLEFAAKVWWISRRSMLAVVFFFQPHLDRLSRFSCCCLWASINFHTVYISL